MGASSSWESSLPTTYIYIYMGSQAFPLHVYISLIYIYIWAKLVGNSISNSISNYQHTHTMVQNEHTHTMVQLSASKHTHTMVQNEP
mgnify:CR=1 FL=1